MEPRFEQFIREPQYLSNVSPATLEWYKHSFKWLRTETPTEEELQEAVMRMREKGLKATGCNSAIRAINAYLKWSGTPHRVLYLKEEQRVLPTFSLPDIKKLLSYRPKLSNLYQRRLHLLILVLLDTGWTVVVHFFRGFPAPRGEPSSGPKTKRVQIRTDSDLRICHVESTDTSEVYRFFWYPCLSCNSDRALHARYSDRSEGRYSQSLNL